MRITIILPDNNHDKLDLVWTDKKFSRVIVFLLFKYYLSNQLSPPYYEWWLWWLCDDDIKRRNDENKKMKRRNSVWRNDAKCSWRFIKRRIILQFTKRKRRIRRFGFHMLQLRPTRSFCPWLHQSKIFRWPLRGSRQVPSPRVARLRLLAFQPGLSRENERSPPRRQDSFRRRPPWVLHQRQKD